ncbi:hypothetical protein INR49_006495 [Caranx melampygus]|nr:hypothetical protein INR49_006495 [Caranx melampygus]
MVLEGHIKIKGVPSVPEADPDEGAATCGQEKNEDHDRDKVSAGVADGFHGNTGILLHWSLGEELTCSRKKQVTTVTHESKHSSRFHVEPVQVSPGDRLYAGQIAVV